jgi:outer membrane biosynthesis protein TonB
VLAGALVAGALVTLAALVAGCSDFGSRGRPAPAASAVAPPPLALVSGEPVELAPAAPAPAPLPALPAARDGKPAAPYSAGYGARLARAVRANIIFPATLLPRVKHPCEIDVSTTPDGRIAGFSVTAASGSREWDDAVKRALLRTRALPPDADGRVPANLVLRFSPR